MNLVETYNQRSGFMILTNQKIEIPGTPNCGTPIPHTTPIRIPEKGDSEFPAPSFFSRHIFGVPDLDKELFGAEDEKSSKKDQIGS